MISSCVKYVSGPDAIAQELKYHKACLTLIHNRVRTLRSSVESKNDNDPNKIYQYVFSELVGHIEEKISDSVTVFRLVEIKTMYCQRLIQYGIDDPEINSTRLKEKILHFIPTLEAFHKGRDILFCCKSDVGPLISKGVDYDEAIILSKASKILRKHMLVNKSTFKGNLDSDYNNESIPIQLINFVTNLCRGIDIFSETNRKASKSDISISHLIQFNCKKKAPKENCHSYKHSAERETAFPVYIGLFIYSKTRKASLVRTLHDHGISISYDRVLEICDAIGESVVLRYIENGVVCPLKMKGGVFTTSAVDNIDHNPTATTSKSSFHGTSISLFQHEHSTGIPQEKLVLSDTKQRKIPLLPDSFTNIQPASRNKEMRISDTSVPVALETLDLEKEFQWLEHVSSLDDFDASAKITWSSHHASNSSRQNLEIGISALLPLLRDQAHDIATIKHVMDRIKEAIEFLNPNQPPVMGADQPLFSLAQQIKWSWPDEYGDCVLILGGLHTEMAIQNMIGKLLQGSEWTLAIEESGVATSGTADSFLKASHVTKTRRALQVTACSLYKLLKNAFNDQCGSFHTNTSELQEWCENKSAIPNFKFWYMILKIMLLYFEYVWSVREGDFKTYKLAIHEILPYLFANDSIHYSKWLTIHYCDMMNLQQNSPDVNEQFEKGHFVLNESLRKFSGLALDQAHEHNNAIVKADGGAVGIT